MVSWSVMSSEGESGTSTHDPPPNLIPRHQSLRTERFKYIQYIDFDWEELYDLLADPEEALDLATDPTWGAELQSLRERTFELRDIWAGLVFADGFENGDLAAWWEAD